MAALISRRRFLARSSLLGCSLAASPLVTPITLAALPGDARLVVIILRGGMDGLDVVRPVGDPSFAALRPGLSDPSGTLPLDGFFAMNAHLSDLTPLWNSGELAFTHAVSTPYRDRRSHFDGQDLLEAGTGMDVEIGQRRNGWLNRMLQTMPGVSAKTAFAVGREDLIILNGAAPVSSWSPEARMDLSPQGRRILEALYHDDPLFREAGELAGDLVEALDLAMDDGTETSEMVMSQMQNAGRAARARALARFAAERMNEETRIAAFSIGGWDTHRTQQNGIKRALGELSDAILTLRETLGENWSRTSVLAMTEFGRTARQNGSGGTDHGTAGAMVMAGGAIRGGRVYGDWPGLGEGQLYQDRDLTPTRDVRSFAGHAVRGLFGFDKRLIENNIFPGLDMGTDPRILL